MRISDIIQEEEIEKKEEQEIDFSNIEKTAELLEALSEEDTLLDELAKLAVIKDMMGLDLTNPKVNKN